MMPFYWIDFGKSIIYSTFRLSLSAPNPNAYADHTGITLKVENYAKEVIAEKLLDKSGYHFNVPNAV